MRELVKRLKNEGFLRRNAGTALSLVDTAEQRKILQRGYFDPMTYIGHEVSSLHASNYTKIDDISMKWRSRLPSEFRTFHVRVQGQIIYTISMGFVRLWWFDVRSYVHTPTATITHTYLALAFSI